MVRISRAAALAIHFVFDELLPPIIRDSKFFAFLVGVPLFRSQFKSFFDFKDSASSMSEAEVKRVYELTAPFHVDRETDLNQACLEKVLEHTKGPKVLDVGAGRGFLLSRLRDRGFDITGTDFLITDELRNKFENTPLIEAPIYDLPFRDREFDTVTCTHTLEHVVDISAATQELRRVCRQRLIIVVPKQRPYRFTFDLHLHFFPYEHSFKLFFPNGTCQSHGGDIFYFEDLVA